MTEPTYFNFAMQSFKCLEKQFVLADETDWYNLFAPECEQIVEKFMKSILELMTFVTVPERLFKSHKLHVIGEFINSYYPGTVDTTILSSIEDFYFDARYPGDDAVIVSRESAIRLKEQTIDICNNLILLHNQLVSTTATNYFEESE